MEPVLHPEEMRRADEAAIAAGTSGFELMDRAAFACATVALRVLGGAYGRRIVVVCGKGNNGGDGIAAARHLARAGARVTALLLSEPAGDPALHLDLAGRTGPRGLRFEAWTPAAFEQATRRADLVVDAIFGTGFSGEPHGPAAEATSALGGCGRRVLAVDIPSPGVRAQVTVAIQALKVAHIEAAGRVDVADIGIPLPEARMFVPKAGDVLAVLPRLRADTNKYERGVAAVLAGSAGMTGAAVLTATAAMRAGAGMVFLGVPRSSLEPVEATVTEAVKVPLPDVEGQLDAKAVDELSDRLAKAQALAVGPGIGRGPRAVALVRRAIDVPLPLVIDADGLNALAEILREEPAVLRGRGHPVVLTPHEGEFARLTGAKVTDRLPEARAAAERWGAVVHLKGWRSITASPDGRAWINTSETPGLATAGTGDVLTGIVTGLVAQGVDAPAAAWAGAFLLGLAGGEHVVASDVAAGLPLAFERLRWAERPQGGPIRTVLEPA